MNNDLINELGQILRWPKKPKDKEMVISFLSSKFQQKKIYSEKDVNQIIDRYHVFNDVPLLRRELIGRSYLHRKDDGSEYWKVEL
tara:strand:+ start:174 stop:428 length:255 start_codon:yes stop_codon:yes gene_type:complete